MTQQTKLGDLEQVVLLAVMRLGPDSYGVSIHQEIEARTGRKISLGAIYPTLVQLEAKGFVTSHLGDPTGQRGGRSRRHFRLEPTGAAALRRSWDEFTALWEGFEPGAAR